MFTQTRRPERLVLTLILLGLILVTAAIWVSAQGPCPLDKHAYDPCACTPDEKGGPCYADSWCTCYAWKRAEESGVWGKFPKDLGDAYLWNNRIEERYSERYQVGHIPAPNAIAVWEENVRPTSLLDCTEDRCYVSQAGGHVAYVEEVHGDTFVVSHMNYGVCKNKPGCWRNYVICTTFDASDFSEGDLHFIYPPGNTEEVSESPPPEQPGNPPSASPAPLPKENLWQKFVKLLKSIFGNPGPIQAGTEQERPYWMDLPPLPTSTPFPAIEEQEEITKPEEPKAEEPQAPTPQPSPTPEPAPNRSQCQDETVDGVLVYTGKGFGGSCDHFTTSQSDLSQTALGMRQVGSIRINGNYAVKLHAATNYGGVYEEINRTEEDLTWRSLGNRYASITIEDTTPQKCDRTDLPGIYLNSSSDQSGDCVYTTVDIPDLDETAIGRGRLQSIRLVGGYCARLCKGVGFGKPCDEINSDDFNLNKRSIGRQYSSVIVLPPPESKPPTPLPQPRTATPMPTTAPQPTKTPVPPPTAAPPPPEETYGAENAGTVDEIKIGAGERVEITIKVRNTGTKPWRKEDRVRLARVDTMRLETDPDVNELELDPDERVDPEEVRTWKVAVIAPDSRITDQLGWRMVQGNSQYFGENIDTWVRAGDQPEDFDAVNDGTPEEIEAEPGEKLTIVVKVKNTGRATWRGDERLCLHRYFASWQIEGLPHEPWSRLEPGETVEPSGSKSWTFEITAPEDGGTYEIGWKMDEKGSGYWFGENIDVEIEVED